jgi:integrase
LTPTLNLAVRDRLLEANPLAMGRVKMLRENNQRERFLTPEEEAKLATVPRGFFLAIAVALHTGLRRSEQFSLLRENVDLKRKFIRLIDTKAGEIQTMRLNPVALAVLQEVLGSHSSPYVFPGKTGHIKGNSISHRLQRACERLKLDGVSWHTLRHTFISRLCMLGVPLPTVQKLARHKSITMTLRYSHLCPDHEEESLQNLAQNYPMPSFLQQSFAQ